MDTSLPTISVVDVRDGGPLRQARERADRARALRDDCLSFFPRPFARCLPILDRVSRRWLSRSRSPYVGEIGAIATALGFPGTWFLNASYQWGCTTLARDQEGAPWIARTLDWPFPGLGRHVEIAHMQGGAGEFFSVGWPGYVGLLTGMAPGRFAAALNQAPMWRRTLKPWLRPYDMAANALRTWPVRHMPPDHLLRETFATSPNFAEARHKLETIPVARPALFTLVGCAHGEACVIERTEEGFATREHDLSAANDWSESRAGWEGRMPATVLLTCSFAEAAENSFARRRSLADWRGDFSADAFTWVTPPVLNAYTRLAVAVCPAMATLRVVGYEAVASGQLPQPVTDIRTIAATDMSASGRAAVV